MTTCVARDEHSPCPNVATLELDTEEGWDVVPTWNHTVPVCEECYHNCHRGGFVNARPITVSA